jgi:hypothetical protein
MLVIVMTIQLDFSNLSAREFSMSKIMRRGHLRVVKDYSNAPISTSILHQVRYN